MKKILHLLSSLLKNCGGVCAPSLKIHPLEIQQDYESFKPFVYVSPISKYTPHKIYVEDLLENKKLLKKLNFDSVCYIFHAYGILRASENNHLYSLIEIAYLTKMIKVKNLRTLKFEEWNKKRFDADYMLLDKKSIISAANYFSSIKDYASSSFIDPENFDSQSSHPNFKLIK